MIMKLNNVFVFVSMLCLFLISMNATAQEVTTIKKIDEKEQAKEEKKRELIRKLANPTSSDNVSTIARTQKKEASKTTIQKLTKEDIQSIQVRIDAKKAALANRSGEDKEELKREVEQMEKELNERTKPKPSVILESN